MIGPHIDVWEDVMLTDGFGHPKSGRLSTIWGGSGLAAVGWNAENFHLAEREECLAGTSRHLD